MKSAAQILKELGFNPESSLETQKAFFKHLATQAEDKPLNIKPKAKTKPSAEPVQLEFNFDESKRVS